MSFYMLKRYWPSLVEIGPVVYDEKMKMWQVSALCMNDNRQTIIIIGHQEMKQSSGDLVTH